MVCCEKCKKEVKSEMELTLIKEGGKQIFVCKDCKPCCGKSCGCHDK
tara:strand:- start:1148 stop:1288 length:141 start_codon:yes stop_codon:yes gene_type:complete